MAFTKRGVAVALVLLAAINLSLAQCGDDESCNAAEGPKVGAAMLQTMGSTSPKASSFAQSHQYSEDVPMTATVTVLEKDMAMIKGKVAVLEGEIGMPAPAALLHKKQEPAAAAASLKARVVALEQDETDMTSRVQSLENVVRGLLLQKQDPEEAAAEPAAEEAAAEAPAEAAAEPAAEPAAPAAPAAAATAGPADFLESRVVHLKAREDDLKARVNKLEQAVTGLQVSLKAPKGHSKATALLEIAGNRHHKVPLKAIVGVLEKDMATIKSTVATLETEVGVSGAAPAAPAAEAAAEEITEEAALLQAAGEGHKATTKEITARVQALEADAADMSSRISTLENVVKGQGGVIALINSARSSSAASGDDLNGRVGTLEATEDELMARVLALQQAVTGLQVKNGGAPVL